MKKIIKETSGNNLLNQKILRRNFILNLLIFASIAIFSFSTLFAMTEDQKIQALLDAVSSSDLIFIRNGTEYSPAQARSHMQLKFSNSGGRINTAEDFIKYLATKSSMTGKLYYVKFKDGKTMPLSVWLTEKLEKLN